ncbi:DUF3373 family protein [Oligoflexus tunisiensis]|uniref:DUF3373 family protein n=1 Tax=Oligoflexus tunisiensis TaxID=708132 RepID=UPI00159F1982|nr:DUF3373 family protein [Oligoflexus tunisiensis]
MKSIVMLLAAATSTPALAQDDLEKRVEALEIEVSRNPIEFGAIFDSRYDLLSYTPEGGKKDTVNLNRMLFSLNMSANLTPKLSLHGRYTMSKVYINYGDPHPGAITYAEGRTYNGSQAYMERAYANYSPLEGLTFSFGRLPTVDGPPTHVPDQTTRQGSYPKLSYAYILDGYGMTYEIPGNSGLVFRYIYSPQGWVDQITTDTDWKTRGPNYQSHEVKDADGNVVKVLPDVSDLHTFMLDYNILGSAIARDINIIGIYIQMNGAPYDTVDNDGNLLFGKYSHSTATGYVELVDIAKSGISLNVSHVVSMLKDDVGTDRNYTLNGSASLVGIGYQASLGSFRPFLYGEYLTSTKGYHFYDDIPEEPFSFYSTRGTAFQLSVTHEVEHYGRLKLGYARCQPDYQWGYPIYADADGNIVTESAKTKDKMDSIYASFRVDI